MDSSQEYPIIYIVTSMINNTLNELFCEIVANNFLVEMAVKPTHVNGNKLDCVLCNQTNIISNVTCILHQMVDR